MAVYNGEKYLAEAIESILGQTFRDFEFIIVDDGSTDQTMELLTSFATRDERIRIIANEKNIGLAESLNSAIEIAQGELIARMDADDISLPDRFEKQVEFLNDHPEIWIVGGQIIKINASGEEVEKLSYTSNPHVLRWNMIFGQIGIVSHPGSMIRKKAFNDFGLYQNLQTCQDLEFWGRFIDQEYLPIYNLDIPILKYRWHDQNIGNTKTEIQNSIANTIRHNLLVKGLGYQEFENDRDIVSAYISDQALLYNSHECLNLILAWLKMYRNFSARYKVDKESQRIIFNQILFRIRVYITLNPFKLFSQKRLNFWKAVPFLSIHDSWRILFYKLRRSLIKWRH